MKNREQMGREFEPKEEVESKVVIDFFRHGKKEKDPEKANKDLQLTVEGIRQGREKGKQIGAQPEVSVGGGSPKDRTRDTALRVMLAGEDEITEDMSMQDIEAKISEELGGNLRKVIEVEGLDYESEESPLPEEGFKAAKDGRYLEWVVKESDAVSAERGDAGDYTAGSHAETIASIIKKYMKVGENFSRVVEKNPNKYKDLGNQIERYFGTHQSVQESFFAKYLEQAEGKEARDKFLETVGNAGFDELDGIHVEIVNKNGEQTAHMVVETGDKHWEMDIDPEVLDQLIEARQ